MKVPVDFVDNPSENDPNIVYIDNHPIEMSTYKIDSFITSGRSVFTIGNHNDLNFGKLSASSYVEVLLPASNDVLNKTVFFDSIELILKPNGSYYGDTTLPFKMKVHRLEEKIENEDASNTTFFNARKFNFNPTVLGETNVTIRPLRATEIKIRLANSFGLELLNKLRNNHFDVQNQDNFNEYLKGLYISSDTNFNKAVYYFTANTSSFIKLHYRLNNTFSDKRIINFSFNTVKQFNNLSFNYSNTVLNVFTPFKKQLIVSNVTNNQAFLNTNLGTYIKFTFPSIFSLKDLHPYVRVMKAELVVTPTPHTYHYPYKLSSSLFLYTTNKNNDFLSPLTGFDGQTPLNGNLTIDVLYGEKTSYTYNITGYINELMAKGKFAESGLMLIPATGATDVGIDRLVINNQNLNKGIQLKLYVLGL
jgi:hypothetical protein